MPQKTSVLPRIPVKQTLVRKTLSLSPDVDKLLQHYLRYYQQQTGLVPTEHDATVSLLEDRLNRDRGFQAFLKAKPVAVATTRINAEKPPSPSTKSSNL